MSINQLFTHPRTTKKAFTYNVSSALINRALSLDVVKNYLKISLNDKTQDELINLFIDSATLFGEKYTNRDFINKTYTTFRDNFLDCFELRRSKVSDVASVKYLVDDVLTTVATTVFGFTNVTDYAEIFLKEDQVWPTDVDNIPQAVEIIFTAGYGTATANIPIDIRIALHSHVAFMFENRGDCDLDGSASNLPLNTNNIYDKNRIINIGSCSNAHLQTH